MPKPSSFIIQLRSAWQYAAVSALRPVRKSQFTELWVLPTLRVRLQLRLRVKLRFRFRLRPPDIAQPRPRGNVRAFGLRLELELGLEQVDTDF